MNANALILTRWLLTELIQSCLGTFHLKVTGVVIALAVGASPLFRIDVCGSYMVSQGSPHTLTSIWSTLFRSIPGYSIFESIISGVYAAPFPLVQNLARYLSPKMLEYTISSHLSSANLLSTKLFGLSP